MVVKTPLGMPHLISGCMDSSSDSTTNSSFLLNDANFRYPAISEIISQNLYS